jgi:hypothetical protein
MNGFDIAIVAVIVLSALFAFARGIVREMLALATWVVGFVLAIAYSGELSTLFSWVNIAPVGRHALAFILILILVMIAGAILARRPVGDDSGDRPRLHGSPARCDLRCCARADRRRDVRADRGA